MMPKIGEFSRFQLAYPWNLALRYSKYFIAVDIIDKYFFKEIFEVSDLNCKTVLC